MYLLYCRGNYYLVTTNRISSLLYTGRNWDLKRKKKVIFGHNRTIFNDTTYTLTKHNSTKVNYLGAVAVLFAQKGAGCALQVGTKRKSYELGTQIIVLTAK